MGLNSRYGPLFQWGEESLGGSAALEWPCITTALQMPHCLTPMGQGNGGIKEQRFQLSLFHQTFRLAARKLCTEVASSLRLLTSHCVSTLHCILQIFHQSPPRETSLQADTASLLGSLAAAPLPASCLAAAAMTWRAKS